MLREDGSRDCLEDSSTGGTISDAPDKSPSRKIEAQSVVVLSACDRKMFGLDFAKRTFVVGVISLTDSTT